MNPRKYVKRLFGALSIMVTLVVLTGCSTTGPAEVSPNEPSAPSQVQVGDSFAEKFPDSQVLADCLNEKGWDVTQNPATGMVGFEGTTEQVDQYEIDVAECMPENDSIPLSEFTSEQWTELYEMELATAECLRAEGIQVEEVPSEQVFIDRYPTLDQWRSYNFVRDFNSDRWNELNTLCPQPGL